MIPALLLSSSSHLSADSDPEKIDLICQCRGYFIGPISTVRQRMPAKIKHGSFSETKPYSLYIISTLTARVIRRGQAVTDYLRHTGDTDH